MSKVQTGAVVCFECGEPMFSTCHGQTLVGYGSEGCPLGRVHDDNCLHHDMRCRNGHLDIVYMRRTCECGWVGKDSCDCHRGKKIVFNPYPEGTGVDPTPILRF